MIAIAPGRLRKLGWVPADLAIAFVDGSRPGRTSPPGGEGSPDHGGALECVAPACDRWGAQFGERASHRGTGVMRYLSDVWWRWLVLSAASEQH